MYGTKRDIKERYNNFIQTKENVKSALLKE
jgi:hypothetical protein